ncbi:MAG: MBL fold metallo-hydrolase [Pseudomonadota bacterium]
MPGKIKVKFWGVRGSIPTPGKETIRYGGNTSCVEIRVADKILIFDGGTGLRLLGEELLKEKTVSASIFFSHFHWDHIQGFPFFTPAFLSKNHFEIFGEKKMTFTLKDALSGQMTTNHFPVTIKQMESLLKFNNINPGNIINLGDDIKIYTHKLNHPGGSMAYKVEYHNKHIVFATDHEHSSERINISLSSFIQDADLLIYDCTYTEDEYMGTNGKLSKKGFGHSTWQEAVRLCKNNNAKRLALFHHDPSHNDAFLDNLEKVCQKVFPLSKVSYEGLELEI